MATNILIGVGGTGAKVVESALMLLAAGLGPESVHVGLVDQDGANGNVSRTRLLLQRLRAFRMEWNRPGSPNYVDWNRPGAPKLGACRIEPLFEDPQPDALWSPNQGAVSLKALMGENLPPERQQLFDMLFMKGGEERNKEQELRLEKGYRGRAHVGAAAIVSSLADANNRLSSRLRALIADAEAGHVNIFLVGSAFGGTGAAGFPTLARMLNRMREDPAIANGRNVRIGGLLMLPYFSFKDVDENAEAAVSSDELLPKSKMALEYYENLFAHEATFDAFYSLGWSPSIPLGYGETGGKEQANPALPPELVAATSATDFFATDWDIVDQEPDVPHNISSRHSGPLLWSDIPDGRSEAQLGQMIRFAAYWYYLVEQQLRRPSGMFSPNWAHTLAEKQKAAEVEAPLDALRQLLHHILLWAATIEVMGGSKHWAGPWSLRGVLDPGHEATPTEPVALRRGMSQEELVAAFDIMVRFDNGDPITRRGEPIYAQLKDTRSVPGDSTGIGRVIAATYDAVRVR